MAEAVDLRVADEQDQALPPISTTYEPACGAAPRTFQPACEEDHRSQNRVGSEEESVEKRPRGGPEVRATDVQGIISVLEAISRRLPALLQSVKKLG